MKARIADAGTKYLAISCLIPASELFEGHVDFPAHDTEQAFVPASNTPDHESPVVATSLITLENFLRTLMGSNCGDMICELAFLREPRR
jgi:hypothetical protein